MPGVVSAGWTAGIVEMDRAIRFPAADWRDGDKINKDKLAAAISDVLAKTFAAKAGAANWNATTGKLKLTFKRPSQLMPGARSHRHDRGQRTGRCRTSLADRTG